MILRMILLVFVMIGFFTGILTSTSITESVIWVIIGIAGLLGVATVGISSKRTIQIIKDVFQTS
ncbi:hypothetical protein [Lentibacillus jeotgali]|uniref:hypothetical protein n=1 Tax=Lentibacillus jeotgali TaxID=558169 RepID=UPI0002625FFC|nr:hypothetical protein [Lentibacillus jeotgali]